MNDNYIIYNRQTGDIYMTIKTEDPMMVALNTPSNCDAVRTDMQNFGEIKSVDIKSKKLRLKAQN